MIMPNDRLPHDGVIFEHLPDLLSALDTGHWVGLSGVLPADSAVGELLRKQGQYPQP